MLGARSEEQRLFHQLAIAALLGPLVIAAPGQIMLAATMKQQVMHRDFAKPRIGDPLAARRVRIAQHVDDARG